MKHSEIDILALLEKGVNGVNKTFSLLISGETKDDKVESRLVKLSLCVSIGIKEYSFTVTSEGISHCVYTYEDSESRYPSDDLRGSPREIARALTKERTMIHGLTAILTFHTTVEVPEGSRVYTDFLPGEIRRALIEDKEISVFCSLLG